MESRFKHSASALDLPTKASYRNPQSPIRMLMDGKRSYASLACCSLDRGAGAFLIHCCAPSRRKLQEASWRVPLRF